MLVDHSRQEKSVMLFKKRFLDELARGAITLAFRRWTRPTVRAGGALRTAIGVLAIEAVDRVTEADITEEGARHAGYPSRAELLHDLNTRDGLLYRVRLRLAGEDRRIALRQADKLTEADVTEIESSLARLDTASRRGPWTKRILRLIADNPGTRAAALAAIAGREPIAFKTDVRKLKELGLTESLKPGYRLSARGRSYLARTAEG
jgi:hypothetical protein